MERDPGRPRLLPANARAKAAGGVGDRRSPARGAGARRGPRRRRGGRRPGPGSAHPARDGGRGGPLRQGGGPGLGIDLRVHRRSRAAFLYGDEYAHSGGAPGNGALLRPEVQQSGQRRRLFRRGIPGRGDGSPRRARPPPAPTRAPAALQGQRRGAFEREQSSPATQRRGRDRVLVRRDRRGDSRRSGHQRAQPGHRCVYEIHPGRRLRLEHRAAAHRRRHPPGLLRAPGRDHPPNAPARPGPGDQHRISLRPGQVVYRPQRQRQAHHALYRALSDRGRRTRARSREHRPRAGLAGRVRSRVGGPRPPRRRGAARDPGIEADPAQAPSGATPGPAASAQWLAERASRALYADRRAHRLDGKPGPPARRPVPFSEYGVCPRRSRVEHDLGARQRGVAGGAGVLYALERRAERRVNP